MELLVALGLAGVVGAAVLRAFDAQARFHSGTVQLLQMRQQFTATHEVIAGELRSMSTPDDVERLSDSAVVYRTAIGGGIACRISGLTIDLAPEQVASGVTLARARAIPQPGDTAWMHDEGSRPGSADDRWHPAAVASVALGRDACLGTPFLDSTRDRGLVSWRLAITATAPLPAGVTAGSVVRLTRRARLALYRSTTSEWNLGWADWNAATGAWNTIQPVTGPFLPFNRQAPQLGGLSLRALDSTGQPLAITLAPSSLASLSVILRGRTDRVVRMDGVPSGRHPDSLRSLITPRNSP